MFEPSGHPRLFGLPPGADFPAELLHGLSERMEGAAPEDWARVELFVNTRRMQRRLVEIFTTGPARLLPRIRLVTDLAADPRSGRLPPAIHPLRRRLELAQLVTTLIEADPTLASRDAVFDLSESLSALLDEMQGEGVAPGTLRSLDVEDGSGHWARTLSFVSIVERYLGASTAQDPEARQRRAVEGLIARWDAAPPDHPVIVAGSTGSRGATALLLKAVARLPQGAVVLPGFDFELPDAIWAGFGDPLVAEDHPQYRFARLMGDLGMGPGRVERWTARDPVPARNRLISMALRPAPVTDQWMRDGPGLGNLSEAARNVSLIEAPTPRGEALAIALCLRDAVERGVTAALITPDRNLTRQVSAALDRWRIAPDDSAGRPLALSAPGRLLRQVARAMGERIAPETLLALLKHPLVHTGPSGRGEHLRRTRELELWLRRQGAPFPDMDAITGWAESRDDDGLVGWTRWLTRSVRSLENAGDGPLPDMVARHLALTETLAGGQDGRGGGALWDAEAGRKARSLVETLAAHADAGGTSSSRDYANLFDAVLAGAEPVRAAERTHPGVMIWGTLEARVQGAELVILGGLSEGTWPEAPPPDPWLNRRLRHRAGLLLPDRRIGLAAHDFQLAAAAPDVVLSRSLRDAEAETVPSRWLNRICNLMAGLPDTGGPEALAAMRARGARWVDAARRADAQTIVAPRARRPAPCPPASVRPTRLSVTEIQTLVRDPYAIYARHVLRLRPLDPLRPEPDARLRGTAIHDILERVIESGLDPAAPGAADDLLAMADALLAAAVPWPSTRLLFRAQVGRLADWFLEGERRRRADASPIAWETAGRYEIPGTGVTLTGKADRIDRRHDGRLVLYDYKTGQVPTDKVMRHFDRQLLLEAVMAEAGAFEGVEPAPVAEVGHIGLGSTPVDKTHRLDGDDDESHLDPATTLRELQELVRAYATADRGYAARRLMQMVRHTGDYDHLARYGEWDESDTPVTERVG